METKRKGRGKIPTSVQVRVFFLDGWLCHWCHRPTVFAPALKYLQEFAEGRGYQYPLAYYDFRYRRDAAPMLDQLAAVIDHVTAYSSGGAHEESNFVTACNKCNVTKSNRTADEHLRINPLKSVKGKYGEPKYWDGFVSIFMILAGERGSELKGSELEWYQALNDYLGGQANEAEGARTTAKRAPSASSG